MNQRTALFLISTVSVTSALTFIDFADSQDEYPLCKSMLSAISKEKPSLLISTGDLWSGDEITLAQWRSCFETDSTLQALLTGGNVRVALGNHDVDDCEGEVEAFSPAIIENGGKAYSFVRDNCFFVALPWNPEANDSSNASFLNSELARPEAKKAAWRIVFEHAPIYSSDELHPADGELCDDINVASLRRACDLGGVDLFLSGHTHDYERTVPIRNGKSVALAKDAAIPAGAGTIYGICGATGGDIDRKISKKAPWWRAVGFDHTRTYLRVDAGSDTLSYFAKKADGKVVDSFQIVKQSMN